MFSSINKQYHTLIKWSIIVVIFFIVASVLKSYINLKSEIERLSNSNEEIIKKLKTQTTNYERELTNSKNKVEQLENKIKSIDQEKFNNLLSNVKRVSSRFISMENQIFSQMKSITEELQKHLKDYKEYKKSTSSLLTENISKEDEEALKNLENIVSSIGRNTSEIRKLINRIRSIEEDSIIHLKDKIEQQIEQDIQRQLSIETERTSIILNEENPK